MEQLQLVGDDTLAPLMLGITTSGNVLRGSKSPAAIITRISCTSYDLCQTSTKSATSSRGFDLHLHSSVCDSECSLYLIRRPRLGEKEP